MKALEKLDIQDYLKKLDGQDIAQKIENIRAKYGIAAMRKINNTDEPKNK